MVKLVAIALVFSVVIIYLRSINSELSLLASIGAGIIIIFYVLNYLSDTFVFISQLVDKSGIDKEFYIIIFKITAIGYLIEFGASTMQDFGLTSLANKLIFAGKVVILSISLPIIYAVYNLIVGLVAWENFLIYC